MGMRCFLTRAHCFQLDARLCAYWPSFGIGLWGELVHQTAMMLSAHPRLFDDSGPKRPRGTCTVSIAFGLMPGDVHIGFHSASNCRRERVHKTAMLFSAHPHKFDSTG